MTLTRGKIAAFAAAVSAAAASAIIGATAVHHFQTIDSAEMRGYRWGNEDGYSLGYNDGLTGGAPDPHRFMTSADHALRTSMGGREIGQ